MKSFEVVILCGAVGPEREVSIRSGRHAAKLLSRHYPVRLIELHENKLPDGLNPETDLIFPLIHGDFGEDGQLQRLLDGGGFTYVGSGVECMELTIDKSRTKKVAQSLAIPVLPEIAFEGGKLENFSFADACERLGCSELFLKPRNKGSSIGCHRICGEDDWAKYVLPIADGSWLLEPLCAGRDLTIGVLQGEPLAILEIMPKHEFFDYQSKYTPDGARHTCPAPLGEPLTQTIGKHAREIFRACNCRDWCRIDFLFGNDGKVYFLEVNTIPGFTDGSLYPECALGAAIAPGEVLCKIIAPAALLRIPQLI
ncbi:MAG: D-alanine--D-alanine ligase [Puniceicoccales bacterium]|nr:D-alanine--D-alanine ligase [Puniceicoccales bacterium]